MPPLTAAEYYAHHYPYEKLVTLLTRNGDRLSDCEFAIEGKTSTGDKLYRRYASVRGPSELRDLVSRFPGVKAFHFGAFYSNGSQKEAIKSGESVPVRRVLSFDIDLTDLEFLELKDADGSVSAEKCDAAYPVSAAAAYIVRTVLQKAFGFSEIMIVYSGRRGVHVHVFDDKAMALDDEGRSAILAYVNCGMAKTELHAPTGVRLIMDLHGLRNLVYNTFHTYIVGRMNIFEKASARLSLLARLDLASYEEYETFAPTLTPLATDVLRCETGADTWSLIEQRIRSTNVDWMLERLDCVVLAYVWPRLDEAVTRSLDHLTKVPFSCHAASGRVAVAMGTDRRTIFTFSPATQAPAIGAWDQGKMDAAVAHFNVDAASTSSALRGGKRKRSGLATCEESQGRTTSKPRRADCRGDATVGGAAQEAATASA
jgi:DNA primase small subunit